MFSRGSFSNFRGSKTESTLGKITQYVRLVDRKLEEKLYWLGEILEDLGSMIAFDGEVATREDHTETIDLSR